MSYFLSDPLRCARPSLPAEQKVAFHVLDPTTVDGNFTRDMISVFEFLSALNIFLSITASLGNALIFVSLHKETSLYPPTKLLFRCLVVTDLSVGVIVQPIGAVLRLFYTGSYWQNTSILHQLHRAISFTLYGVSVFTTSAISLDRLLALFSGLRYRHVVTLPRARAVIISFWLSGLSCGSMFFLKSKIAFTVAFVLILICVSTSVLSYTKIYRKLRQHQLEVHPMSQRQPHGPQVPMNIARFKKSVSSVLWVQFTAVICYIPFIVVVMFMTYGRITGNKFEITFDVATTLTYLKSSLNPILYCWRIKAVQQAAKETIKKVNLQ